VTIDSVVDDRLAYGRRRTTPLARELGGLAAGLPARLAAISRSRSAQRAIADRSYWHPNGFLKLVLDDDPRDGQLRLHVWPAVSLDHDIHGHSWDYESLVVAGAVREQVYRESDGNEEGEPMWRHTYLRVGPRRFSLTDPVPVRLVPVGGPVVLRSGRTSGGTVGHIHSFHAWSEPAVTMLRVGLVKDARSPVYRRSPEQPQAVVPTPASRLDVAEWVDRVLQVAPAPAGAA
jgi:hypothetical protein